MKPILFAAVAAMTTLTACQEQAAAPEPAATPATAADQTAVSSSPVTASAPAVGLGDASLEPQPMKLGEWRGADLKGELGCGFARKVGELPVVFAASFVDPKATSDAAMKFAGRVVKLTTASTGGFDALSTGARFAGPDGLFANVVRSGARIAEAPKIAEESPRYPALLVVSKGGRELSDRRVMGMRPLRAAKRYS